MLTPVNGHLLIEPLVHESFVASQKGSFEEIGIVLSLPRAFQELERSMYEIYPKVGDKVYFDSWLAAKYPKNENEFYWLVKWEDVRAIEKNETLPE